GTGPDQTLLHISTVSQASHLVLWPAKFEGPRLKTIGWYSDRRRDATLSLGTPPRVMSRILRMMGCAFFFTNEVSVRIIEDRSRRFSPSTAILSPA
ncbi:MAG: hypothetical protein ACI97A_004481, partial [Planctomycetota bacterium]